MLAHHNLVLFHLSSYHLSCIYIYLNSSPVLFAVERVHFNTNLLVLDFKNMLNLRSILFREFPSLLRFFISMQPLESQNGIRASWLTFLVVLFPPRFFPDLSFSTSWHGSYKQSHRRSVEPLLSPLFPHSGCPSSVTNPQWRELCLLEQGNGDRTVD